LRQKLQNWYWFSCCHSCVFLSTQVRYEQYEMQCIVMSVTVRRCICLHTRCFALGFWNTMAGAKTKIYVIVHTSVSQMSDYLNGISHSFRIQRVYWITFPSVHLTCGVCDSSVGIVTCYVQEFRASNSGGAEIFRAVQTGSEARPAYCKMGTGSFLAGKQTGAWCWPPITSKRRGCEWVGSINSPPLCTCIGMSWGDLNLYLLASSLRADKFCCCACKQAGTLEAASTTSENLLLIFAWKFCSRSSSLDLATLVSWLIVAFYYCWADSIRLWAWLRTFWIGVSMLLITSSITEPVASWKREHVTY
jgi:hypothetical protein